MSRSESITGRRLLQQRSEDGPQSDATRSAFEPPSTAASEIVVINFSWPAETLLKLAGILFGARPEYLMMMDTPPTLFGTPTAEAHRRTNAFELLADENRTREPLTMASLSSKLLSVRLSQLCLCV